MNRIEACHRVWQQRRDTHLRSGSLCYPDYVKRLSAIGRLLSILALVGLVLGPLARPAMTMPAAIQPDHAAMDHAAMAMPEEMPCCPAKAPIPDCGNDCTAICAMQFLCNVVQSAGLSIPIGLTNVLLPGSDAGLVGMSQRPPPRPPKI